MEERQIQAFVRRVLMDQEMKSALMRDPAGVIQREGYTPRVAAILLRLVPCLTFEQPMHLGEKWWHA
jgi:hypothetical protein